MSDPDVSRCPRCCRSTARPGLRFLIGLLCLVAGAGQGRTPAQEPSSPSGPAPAATAPASPVSGTAPRVIERSPDGGLPYRLTLGAEATAAEPHRLVVWLHPSGGFSYNAPAEALAPLFIRHGFALLVMTGKDFRGWTYDDARKLLGVTLPDAAKLPGVDARRPLLMGFSSGGQVALEFWLTKPDLYGGLILDAAYPVEERGGEAVVLAPPRGDAVETVPIFVLVGEKDALLPVWKEAEKPWREAGVPLTIRVVPGKGHEWLFGEAEVAALEEWLGALPGGAGGGAQAVAPPQEEPEPAVQP